MAWVLKKAGYSIFITTLTTAVAFLGNCVSRVSAIRSFGLFLGLLVSVNYCLVMTVYASSLVLFDSGSKYSRREWHQDESSTHTHTQ
jgi:predicted RND superfamily exporter protein